MATQVSDSERVQLIVGGLMHDDWESYEIDSDLLIPADAWRLTIAGGDSLPEEVKEDASVEVRIGGDPVLVGRIDTVEDVVSKRGVDFHISGRDRAAILVDCSAPIFVARMATIDEIAAKVVRALGVAKIDIRAGADNKAVRREKINIEPGDTAWSVLSHAAEAVGLWPWFDPDGTLVIGGPDYTAPEVASLVMRRDGRGNNLVSLARRRAIHGRYSHMTVLGQTHGTATKPGENAIRGDWKDKDLTSYRPRIVVDHESDTPAIARERARKLLADSRLKALTLNGLSRGHRIVAPGMPGDGLLWQPGQRVHIESEPHGIDGTFFLMARRFVSNRKTGPQTQLVFKEDGAWVLDAHPHKRRHRRGKNDVHAQIIDASKGANQ